MRFRPGGRILGTVRVVAVPVKRLEEAKSRLASVLAPLERAALTLAMLEDVLDAVLALDGWIPWVVSSDEAVLEIAARRRARPFVETTDPPRLGAAVRQAEETALTEGADALAILLADLPLLTADALHDALRTVGPVVLAPSSSDGGTNLLLRRPPDAIPARFGSRSFHRHRSEAAAKGLPVSVVRGPKLAFDLDRPPDLLEVLRAGKRGRTASVCLELGVAERLRVSSGASR